ncbi:MAG: hypothetical protein VB021_10135, partial [Oscillospiraceae bacterium]|nr:hypothetical protein [Oscillospiraceae bacterium]
MFISDTDPLRRRALRAAFVYLLVAAFCAFFGGVYEHFSHDVWSAWMVYAFAFPLAGGALPMFALALYGARLPGRTARSLWACGLAALTLGSVMTGVLEIYGSTNGLIAVYWWVGAARCAAGHA